MKSSNILQKAAACMTAAILVLAAAQAKEGEGMSRDHIMMQDGKMMVMKDGKMMPMKREMDLPNGTKIMPDGTVMMKDGTKKMMKNGEAIGMDGMMMHGKAHR